MTDLIEYFLSGSTLPEGDLVTVTASLSVIIPTCCVIAAFVGFFWLLGGVFKR